ncbi:hypothetical protein B0T22DRAFT_277584 [Podospora appendiculata]|uniref:Uncharacterized protein n=1 Tax=Podospora appendiculata TaxID=314037 RepID=A0AAE1C7T8_9PEZI|nr:hypothetical protein B0T22DRAFT_277584 [Podospora appendiculata]
MSLVSRSFQPGWTSLPKVVALRAGARAHASNACVIVIGASPDADPHHSFNLPGCPRKKRWSSSLTPVVRAFGHSGTVERGCLHGAYRLTGRLPWSGLCPLDSRQKERRSSPRSVRWAPRENRNFGNCHWRSTERGARAATATATATAHSHLPSSLFQLASLRFPHIVAGHGWDGVEWIDAKGLQAARLCPWSSVSNEELWKLSGFGFWS